MNTKANEKIKELKEKGITVYSHSRLSTMNTCEWEYYNTYVLRNRGQNNFYTEMGSQIHLGMEQIYGDGVDISQVNDDFESKLLELEMLGINLPNEKIGAAWKSDMRHFLANFNKIDKKMIQEKLIVFEVADGIWMQGYIDSILPSDQGKPYVDIIDWKTSSRFSGKKLDEAGRQLLMYKLGIESTTNLKVDKIMWFMIKYLYVCWKLKNGKIKKKMCNRGKWVKEMSKTFEKEMLKSGIDELEIGMLIDQAVRDNSIDNLPDEIKSKYWIEDCFVEYEATPEKEEELKQYVIDTVHKIESKSNDESEWQPIEINKYNSFYCSTLCGHRSSCYAYKQFLDENSGNFEKKKDNGLINFDDLFN